MFFLDTQPGAPVRLQGALDIKSVSDALPQLEPLAAHQQVEFELSGLELIDTAGVQLLVWLKERRGAQLTLKGATRPVREVFTLAGLEGWLS